MFEPCFVDSSNKPSDAEIKKSLGKTFVLWQDLYDFIEENYAVKPETIFYGKKYGWLIRYRKSGKALCSLYPDKNSFTVNVVLGGKEVEKVKNLKNELSSAVWSLFNSTKQLHDGRWLWINVTKQSDVESIKHLLLVKRKPQK